SPSRAKARGFSLSTLARLHSRRATFLASPIALNCARLRRNHASAEATQTAHPSPGWTGGCCFAAAPAGATREEEEAAEGRSPPPSFASRASERGGGGGACTRTPAHCAISFPSSLDASPSFFWILARASGTPLTKEAFP
ncbi:unnamed protein product, partial [Ectocarpus sp. 12 AP-2014]